MPVEEKVIREIAGWIEKSENIVIFSGAGISTESGIPDFRSPGGIWERYDPREFTYQHFMASAENRKTQWQMFREIYESFAEAEPNAAHLAGAELERMGKLYSVITQNVDGLHQKAGNSEEKVIELHGTVEKIECIGCRHHFEKEHLLERVQDTIEDFRCQHCSGILKPAAVLFGEAMPQKEMERANESVSRCDLCFSIGSSLVVYPAAYFPVLAKQHGARLIIINREPTPADRMADAVVHGSAGEVMEKVLQMLK